ncbi:hypothetical protein B0I37DRAFT_351065 [Chaetomium sp. MPI-CAGE-AT-0009]|nr:hypothetical protein B0I37DRAFT_351065 [Chaetomium sp. MPI-CAGE-AT-0009]
MVQVPIVLLAAVGCLLSSSSFFASGSPLVPTERDVGPAGSYTFVEGPIEWRGTLEEGKEPVYLSGDTFEDIEAKAKALNPTYTIFDNSSVALEARDVAIAVAVPALAPATASAAPGILPSIFAMDTGIRVSRMTQESLCIHLGVLPDMIRDLANFMLVNDFLGTYVNMFYITAVGSNIDTGAITPALKWDPHEYLLRSTR